MGKKSLFEPTIAPEEEKSEPAKGKVRDKKKATKAQAAAPPEPEAAPVAAAGTDNPPVEPDAPTPAPEPKPAVKQDIPPVVKMDASPPVQTKAPSPAADLPPFDSDPLIDFRTLMTGVVVVCGLILLVLLGSLMNADNYYVKQVRGAVEIWKGDFSPGGKERVLILHGARWLRPFKSSYSKAEVFPFAAAYYLDKANMLTDAPVSEDFDRILYYLDRVQSLYAEEPVAELDSTIKQIRKTIAEARILQASGEKAALDLAQAKLRAVSQALMDLAAELTGESGAAPATTAAAH